MKLLHKIKAIKIFLFAFLLFVAGTTNAQVGIGTANPNTSAQLDVNSTSKGFLPPRMTQAQRAAISSPVAGLTIWCKDCGILGELQVYNGATWTNMTGAYASMPLPATVTIGTQVWMIRNLDVVTYRNGDTIPEVKDPTEWANLTTGAWCYYNNDPALGAIYGKLYNHAAVVDPRGLAPEGWHIPSDSYDEGSYPGPYSYVDGDWRLLAEYLDSLRPPNIYSGPSVVAGDKMRASTLWTIPNTIIANQIGFTGLPGGQRDKDGSFNSIGTVGRWWSTGRYLLSFHLVDENISLQSYVTTVLSTTSFDPLSKINFHYTFNQGNVNIDTTYSVGYGLSVRCVKD